MFIVGDSGAEGMPVAEKSVSPSFAESNLSPWVWSTMLKMIFMQLRIQLAGALLILSSILMMTGGKGLASEPDFKPELFAFQTGFANASAKDPESLVRLVNQSGFDGIELMGLGQVEQFLPLLKEQGLKLHSIYLKLDLDQPGQPVDPRWSRILDQYGKDIEAVWFHVHSREYSSSDPAGDERCVKILRTLSDQVTSSGIKIGIYHHVGLWAERFSDGVRIARKVDRPNVGAVFNLCHYLKTVGPASVENELSEAFPHVALVSINGADDGETTSMGWSQLIQPLDQGSFDVARVLKVLKKSGYEGPIGLQGFGVREKPEQFFPRSVAAYRMLLMEVNQDAE